MSAAAVHVPAPTAQKSLDDAVSRLRDNMKAWAKASIRERIQVGRQMLQGYHRVAERSVRAACEAKGIPLGTPQEGDEWLGGPWTTIRGLRLVLESLEQIEQTGTTRVGPTGRTADGRLTVQVYPMTTLDKLLFPKVSAEVHFLEGVTEEQMHAERARFYKKPDHEGKVCLVLGAGNVNSIPPLDVVTKLFNEGKVCLLKMNPVNAYVGPFIEEAFAAAIERGWLQVVYGGGEEGAYLCRHDGVDEIHITGSDKTHDMIVWGPPGPEREARKARNEPLLKKEISSELGNISPVLVVPGPYSEKELDAVAENVAGAVTNNASFNCNAAKMVVSPKGWERRDAFLAGIEKAFGHAPTRKAYYPGAEDRYAKLLAGKDARKVGQQGDGYLPFTLVPGLDAEKQDELAFQMEPFCAILNETSVGSTDPVEYLEKAVAWANDKLWGTLAATIMVHPRSMKDPAIASAVRSAIAKLRYGAVGVNLWPGSVYGLGTAPWGAHPSSPLTDIQGGHGFVHNSPMLEGIEKAVAYAPLVPSPKLPYFPSHRSAHVLARRLSDMEADMSWLRLPGIVAAAMSA